MKVHRSKVLIEGVRLIEQGDKVVLASRRKWGGTGFEPESMRAWRGAVRRGATAVDAGAYTGIYTVAAAQEGSLVWSFEPNPGTFERLKRNVELNEVAHRCELHQAAVAEEIYQAEMTRAEAPLTSAARVERANGGAVDVFPLDFVLCECATISAIKLDVEGGEVPALIGAERTIERDRPLLIVETLDYEARSAVSCWVAERGYRCREADGRNLICEAT